MVTVTLPNTRTGPRTVDGETATPGLSIVPETIPTRDGVSFTGDFRLIHTDSGLNPLPGGTSGPIGIVRELAQVLTSTGIDWTADATTIRTTPGYANQATRIRAAFEEALQTNNPILPFTRTWRPAPPTFDLIDGTNGDLIASVATEPEAFNVAASYAEHEDAPFDHQQCYVTRGDTPIWSMYCARQECHAYIEDPETTGVTYAETRENLAEYADEDGWQRRDKHGSHWLCPTCVKDFR